MYYCTRCLYPSTKPDIWFNKDGLCSACIAFDFRASTDWAARKREFEDLVYYAKRNSYNPDYDCIVPVSGGKDSHAQLIRAIEFGLKPLAVCATTCDLSKLGRENLNNIATITDLVEVTPNRDTRRRINNYGLQTVGDISWPEHQLIFTIPLNVAQEKCISLVIWGENPQNEYGAGPIERIKDNSLGADWLSEFGGLNGLRLSDLVEKNIISEQESNIYKILDPDHGIKSVYLGHYFPWDGLENSTLAKKHGFKTYNKPVEGIGYDYENLDNLQTGIHDYFKFIKFGFGRSTDLVCNHIRRNRISRKDGIDIINQYDGAYPSTYLGVPLQTILDKIDVTIDQFLAITYKFTNKKLFEIPSRTSNILRPIPKFKVGEPCLNQE